ncbi:hypothetical protein ACFYZB_11420 [Streptomyces sp. NPDC001852]|uniref:hypothetical protein n=1 Tax=Streptomyces sp. NPDC001852 TaxID=3364619 RepID=UPI00367D4098
MDGHRHSYLTRLALDGDSAVRAPAGRSVTMTVDGTAATVTSGTTHTGAITLTVA